MGESDVSLALMQNKRQSGAALILALLVVSIVVILAATVSSDFLVALRRVENQLYSQQAYAYLRGAEVMARQVLQEDFNVGKTKDHYSEGWLEVDQQVELANGVLTGRLTDLQGRLNINNLMDSPNPRQPGGQRFSDNQLRFIRLLQLLPLDNRLDQLQAEQLTRAVADWLDSDENTEGGAETLYYSDLELPMQSANQAMHSISELQWVRGMTREIFTALAPFICALPKDTLLNVNTASEEVLRTLVEDDSGSDIRQILSERDGEGGQENASGGFETVADFNQAFTNATGGGTNANTISGVAVNSEYFLLTAQTVFVDRLFQMRTVLYRDGDGKVKVHARSYTDI